MSDPLTWEDPPVFNGLPAEDNLPLVSFPVRVAPPDVDPDDCAGGDTICVRYRAEWQPFVAGAISQLTLPSTWEGTYEEQIIALNRAELLKWMFCGGQTDVGNCGCTGADPLTRWTADGTLEFSNDGGTTWSSFPQGDPRTYGNYFPPLPLEAGDLTKCAAADNIVASSQAYFDQLVDQLRADADVVQLVEAAAGGIAIFLGEVGVAIAFFTVFATNFFNYGADAIAAAFDEAVWDRFRCNLFSNSQSDGSFTDANITAIKAQIDVDETGIANVLLKAHLDDVGTRGLTNMGRAGSSDGTGCEDCVGCEDGCTTHEVSFVGLLNDLPEGFSITYSAGGVASTDNLINHSGTGTFATIHFPDDLCVQSVGFNRDAGGGTITCSFGGHDFPYTGSGGTSSNAEGTPILCDSVSWSSDTAFTTISSITLEVCD